MIAIVIIFGLVFTLSVGAFVALMLTSGMKDGIIKIIVGIIIAFVVGFGIIGLLEWDQKNDFRIWNNGVCRYCETDLELFDIAHYHNGGKVYYWKCENGHIIETSYNFVKRT